MRSKNESYAPPDESETWSNKRFTIVLDYLCEQKVAFNGEIFLQWIAAPYVSIWNANSLEQHGAKVWIMHNEFISDYFIDRDIKTPQEAIHRFGMHWKKTATELKRTGENLSTIHFELPDDSEAITEFANTLSKHAGMLLGIAGDDEIWNPSEAEEPHGACNE